MISEVDGLILGVASIVVLEYWLSDWIQLSCEIMLIYYGIRACDSEFEPKP